LQIDETRVKETMNAMAERKAVVAIGAGVMAALGAGAAAMATTSIIQNPRIPRIDQEELWKNDPERTAVVIGIGGAAGAIWEAATLAEYCRSPVDPREAGLIIGTSAGSLSGVMLRSNITPQQLTEFATNGRFMYKGTEIALPDPRQGVKEGSDVMLPWVQAIHAMAHGRVPHMTATLTGLLAPEGFTLNTVADAMNKVWEIDGEGTRWPSKPLWIPATNLYNGQRIVFGAAGEPEAEIGWAVAASCAVPGVLAPVKIQGQHYADGGVVSFTSLDLALRAGAKRILILNPMVGYLQTSETLMDKGNAFVKSRLGKKFDQSIKDARKLGVKIRAVTPSPSEIEAIGPKLLDFDRGEIIVKAVQERYKETPIPDWY
jgi:NTE family protein